MTQNINLLITEKNPLESEYNIEYLKRGYRTVSLVETIVYIGLIYIAGLFLSPEDPFFSAVSIHPFFVIAFLIPMRYGLGESAFASLICALILGISIYSRVKTDLFSWIYFYSIFKVPLVMMCLSIFGGYIREEALEREKSVEDALKSIIEEKNKLSDRLAAAETALVELETRILSSENDILDHINDFSDLFFEDIEDIKKGLLSALITYTRCKEAVYADVKDGSFVSGLCKSFSESEFRIIESEMLNYDPVIMEAFTKKEPAKLGDCLTAGIYNNFVDFSIIAVPIKDYKKKLIGVAALRKIPFINYTPYTVKAAVNLCRLWETGLADSIFRSDLNKDVLLDKRLGIGTKKHFLDHFESEFKRHEKLNYNLFLGVIKITRSNEITQKQLLFIEKILIELLFSQNIYKENIFRFTEHGAFAVLSDQGTDKNIITAFEASARDFEKLAFKTSENKDLKCSFFVVKRDTQTRDFNVFKESVYEKI
jgi:hypothetical protein